MSDIEIKTVREVCNNSPEYAFMVRAMVRQMGGKDNMRDVIGHGAGGGVPGFIYYADTARFFKSHKKDILKLAQEYAGDVGEDMLSMVAGFQCLKDMKLTATETGEALFADSGEYKDQIHNAMAWFAVETVAAWFEK